VRPASGRPRAATLATGTVLALCALLVVSLAFGATDLPVRAVVAALLGPLAPTVGLGRADPAVAAIIVELRLPRALLAATVGAGLGLAGLLLQTASRNDLADPWLFGLSSGAAAGAAFVLLHAGDVLGPASLPAAAFAGGALAAATVLALARRAGTADPHRIVLAGLAVSFLFGAPHCRSRSGRSADSGSPAGTRCGWPASACWPSGASRSAGGPSSTRCSRATTPRTGSASTPTGCARRCSRWPRWRPRASSRCRG
jgi:hypothetical protein